MMSRRQKLSKAVERKIQRMYSGKQCVIRGSDSGVAWHHLDETPKNSRFENIVPIEATVNSAIEAHRKSKRSWMKHPLPWDADPELLAVRARSLYDQGWITRSYACTLLAGTIQLQHLEQPRSAITNFKGCVFALRPRADRLALSTLKYLFTKWIIPTLRTIPEQHLLRPACSVLTEIASWLVVHGESQSSVRILDEVERLLQQNKSWTLDDWDHTPRARVLQHRGVAKILAGDRAELTDLKESTTGFQQEKTAKPINNNLFWEAFFELKQGRLNVSRNLAQRTGVFEFAGPGRHVRCGSRLPLVSFWATAELLGLRAEIERRKGHSRWVEWARAAYELFREAGITPLPIHTSDALGVYQDKYVRDEGLRLDTRTDDQVGWMKGVANQVLKLIP